MTEIRYVIVEAFTIGNNQGYTGNPAAVCFLETDDQLRDEVKQKIAATFNLSETVFVSHGWSAAELAASSAHAQIVEQKPKILKRTIRWFTPTSQVPLCGHGTLASASALVYLSSTTHLERIEFQSKYRGLLPTLINSQDTFTLNFPANTTSPCYPQAQSWLPHFTQILLGQHFNGIQDLTDLRYSSREKALLLVLKPRDEEDPLDTIKKVQPHFEEIKAAVTALPMVDAIVTIKAKLLQQPHSPTSPHFFSRVFSPWVGLDEDPVTGSAHTILAPYWSEILGERDLYARQVSERQGDLKCRLVLDRVELTGRANIFATGTITL